jgi:DNA-3-methyladenine glycosylase II
MVAIKTSRKHPNTGSPRSRADALPADAQRSQPISLELPYAVPYDWKAMLSNFRGHKLPNLEAVDDLGYERVINTAKGLGWFRVSHSKKQQALQLSVWNGGEEDIQGISANVRRMFDLDVKPTIIGEAMSADAYLYSLWNRYPGLRVARRWNGFEALFTTIMGQLVSVSFGRILTGELMKTAGTKALHPKTSESIYLFPTANQILSADLSGVRTSESRRSVIRSLATLVVDGTLNLKQHMPPTALRKMLLSVSGIGAWTSEYVAMHGFDDNDAFPATDYGLKQELKRHPDLKVGRVRPWRAYAAILLWKSFAEAKGASYESLA